LGNGGEIHSNDSVRKCFISAKRNKQKITFNKLNANSNADKMESVTRTSYVLGVKNDTAFSSFPLFKTYSSLFTKWLKDFTENIFRQILVRREDPPYTIIAP
jgi:hypothetical protein